MHIQTPHLHILTLSHTNTLNHYHFILKPKKKKKTKHTTHPIANLQIILKNFKEKYQTKQKKKKIVMIHTHKKT